MRSAGGFRIEITRPAALVLTRLPRKYTDAILRFLDGPLADNPYRVTKSLIGQLDGLRSGYVGISYRVMIRVDEETRTVYVVRIAHRADAYRTE